MKLNIRKLFNVFDSPKPIIEVPIIHGRTAEDDNPRTQFYRETVDHALLKYLTTDEANSVINDYRRSPWNEDALNHDISTLDSDEHYVPKDEHYEHALDYVYRLIKPDVPLQPVHFADLRHYKWRLSTNVGAPFNAQKKWKQYVTDKFNHYRDGTPFDTPFSRDLFAEAHQDSLPLDMTDARLSKHNLYSEMFFINRKHIHQIKLGRKTDSYGNDLRFWNTAFARQHIVQHDEPDKVRLVFGCPSLLLMAELMFIWPLQAHLLHMKSKSPLLWGYETLLGGWYRLRNFFTRVMPRLGAVITIDFSGFDKRARHTVIRDIHSRIMRPLYTFKQGYAPTHKYPNSQDSLPRADEPYLTTEEKMTNLWTWMTNAVLTVPLLLPNGDMIQFTHSGIFSGYFQTQILDSLYNMVMLYTILFRLGYTEKQIAMKVQGDDSIFTLLCCFFLIIDSFMYLFKHYAMHYFGALVSEKKSEILESLEHAEVLKYRNSNGFPYRDELQLLAQLRHPERSTTAETLAARCVGIAYADCGKHPRIYLICEDIYTFLTKKLNVIPRQKDLNFLFQHLEITNVPLPDVSYFPSHFDTLRHLADLEHPIANKHWPLDHFLGLPGRR
jgi:hypothetical protein